MSDVEAIMFGQSDGVVKILTDDNTTIVNKQDIPTHGQRCSMANAHRITRCR